MIHPLYALMMIIFFCRDEVGADLSKHFYNLKT